MITFAKDVKKFDGYTGNTKETFKLINEFGKFKTYGREYRRFL